MTLGSNAAACGSLKAQEVAGYAKQLRSAAAYEQQQRSLTKPNLSNPSAIRNFSLRTMPKMRPPIGSWHQTTAVEFATFRAGNLMVHGASVSQAMAACRQQALVASRGTPQPNWQSCPSVPCSNIRFVRENVDTNGGYSGRNINTKSNVTTGTSGYSSSGSQTAAGSRGGLVTISNWEPFVNGGKGGVATLPAVQEITTTSTSSFVANLPQPNAVPQSGWIVLPGTPFWAWIGSGEIVVELDSTGNDYYIVNAVANNGFQVTFHGINPANGQELANVGPITYPQGSTAAIAANAVSPIASVAQSTWLAIGAACVTIGAALIASGFVAPGAITAGAGIIIIYESQYQTDDVSTIDWSVDSGDFSSGGIAGGGIDPPGEDEYEW